MPGAEYFDGMYSASDDPWDYAHSPYERRKYALTLASLPRDRYARALEPACSVGELTALLAGRCDHVLAVDRAERATELARRTLRRYGVDDRVEVRSADLRDVLPTLEPASFDLVVLSEILYYVPPAEAAELAVRTARVLAPGGTMVLVHWRGVSPDHACTGDEVHELAIPALTGAGTPGGLRLATSLVDEGFLLDVLVAPAAEPAVHATPPTGTMDS